MFLRNAWYVAAWADELGEGPFARRILNEPIVLFRTAAGTIAALADRCCHRGAPLAFGKIVADGLQCGYHGLVFDQAGKCVAVPGGHTVPPGARVRSYPVIEKNQFVWIWMGDPKRADHSSVFDYPYHDDPQRWPHRHRRLHIQSDYLLVVDNLMDLSHLSYVHGATVGGMPDAHVEAKMHTTRTTGGVRYDRWMIDSVPPPTYIAAGGFKGRVDRWQESEFFAPSTIIQWIGAVDAGTGSLRNWKYDGDRNDSFSFRLFHGITPETDTSCHYFWSAANGYRQHEPAATDQLCGEIARTFDQDKVIIEAQQARVLETPDDPLLDIHGDAARIHARRVVEQLLAEEHHLATGNSATSNRSAIG
jgi:phenylpropionate dioxygenase-like ring-hydroxylating dioxygenase large terminal subunit